MAALVPGARSDLSGWNATMANLAGVMASPLGNMPMEKVIDETGLSEHYDLTLDFKDFNPKDPEFHNYIEMRAALIDFASQALERSLRVETRTA